MTLFGQNIICNWLLDYYYYYCSWSRFSSPFCPLFPHAFGLFRKTWLLTTERFRFDTTFGLIVGALLFFHLFHTIFFPSHRESSQLSSFVVDYETNSMKWKTLQKNVAKAYKIIIKGTVGTRGRVHKNHEIYSVLWIERDL